jgi:methylenetetrahydrofolate dehydrogenase (NADP+)/methenyltetrahydrofolate cyclohydrolase
MIINGLETSKSIKEEIRLEVEKRRTEGRKIPHLAAILVGADGASETYVANKIKSCELVGFQSSLFRFENTVSEAALLEKIHELNADASVDFT